MSEHRLKTVAQCFDAVARGEKTFEVRLNDRFYQRGDTVVLMRLDWLGRIDGREIRKRVGWMLQGGQFGVDTRYCVFSLEDAP